MIAYEKKHFSSNKIFQNILIAACIGGSLVLLGWLIRYSSFGFDFTDESFYVVSMANPFLHDYSHTQFGFLYHPIYLLLGGDLVLLRRLNILLTFFLALWLSHSYLRALVPELRGGSFMLLAIAAGLSTSTTIIFDAWLLTPSYNSLALQALMLTGVGLLHADREMHRWSIFGWVLVGIGGWIAFMAKPSTALALAFGVLLYAALARKLSWRMFLLTSGVSLSLLVAGAIAIDGSVMAFAGRIERAIAFGRILGSGHTLTQILRFDTFQLAAKTELLIYLLGSVVGLFAFCLSANGFKWMLLGLVATMGLFLLTLLLAFGLVDVGAGFGQFQELLYFGLVLAAVFAGLLSRRKDLLAGVNARQWSIALLFLLTPHIYAFGTNSNYWQVGGAAAIFWLLASLVFLRSTIRACSSWLVLLPLAVATQTIAMALLQTGFEQPYRQPQPIRLNDSAITFGARPTTLVLSASYARYIAEAISAAQGAGFEPGTPVIDLSGQSPGLLYALGASSIGQAWNVGAYPGSLKLAEVALDKASCDEIASAWVLFEAGGPRSIPNELMRSVGSGFPEGYARVGVFSTAPGAGGYAASRTQEIYKPVARTELLHGCKLVRKSIN